MIERINISKELKDRLRNKLVVLHPPQEILIDRKAFEDKFNNMECVRMVFVGHDFFRKGGDIILTVLKTLAPNYNFKITIVSKLNYGDYASLSTEEDYRKCKQLLDECPWIEYYEALPNKKVLDIIKQAHIGLLPSLSETYGYSVLEMQASGCACVTTNIRALGEINNDNCGWICDIHPNEFGESIYSCYSKEQKRAVHLQLQAELKKVFKNILSNPAGIEEKAYNALERIKCYHDPVRYSKCLEDIYKR